MIKAKERKKILSHKFPLPWVIVFMYISLYDFIIVSYQDIICYYKSSYFINFDKFGTETLIYRCNILVIGA
jgi:hypothetical protein